MSADVATAGPAAPAPELRDGYEVHQAALRRGLNVIQFPRQVMMATPPDGAGTAGGTQPQELSFAHGVPQTSTLSAVTYAQDKRMRRALLTNAGLPIPKGGAYSVGKGMEFAKRLIERIGYPVVVKPAIGDNTIETRTGLRDEDELASAIDYLRIPTTSRPTYTRAAFALTLLSEPEELDGRVMMPSSYRFLLEKHVSGEYLRFLVLGDEVCSVVHCPGGPWAGGERQHRDVTGETHTSLTDLARQAVRAVPGLAVAAVDIVTGDHTADAEAQDPRIVELSERPWLAIQAGVSARLSQDLGDAILRSHAAELDLGLGEQHDEVAVDLHMEGVTEPAKAIAAVAEAGRNNGLTGHVSVTDPVEGIADGVVQGRPDAIALLTENLLDARIDGGYRAALVEERGRPVERMDPLAVRD
ncbi:hypothetical protein SAMN06265360_10114 [Haloechinothrix alba]|uniref:ATP-grasp domain-containing protein n=1 Tax=Haloechinothrix alba TaxID=664784 RepID=A0A238UYI3_9PSEU|nr:hypothetical protein [Haloechinothrix alba]SNR27058.1 hypothetical protein SAMN06265360_10114 [Haloechinothrix alba]